ncbi:MAG TPA: hypothetical protein VLW44_02980, partial [Streptosporangiaceae bacterium]|nr:hypothetical protein [Streptosporangiaceae bacterium]
RAGQEKLLGLWRRSRASVGQQSLEHASTVPGTRVLTRPGLGGAGAGASIAAGPAAIGARRALE